MKACSVFPPASSSTDETLFATRPKLAEWCVDHYDDCGRLRLFEFEAWDAAHPRASVDSVRGEPQADFVPGAEAE
jgi:hypothetical protein